jgi:DNA-binding Xre family transcriptional regulator
MAKKFNINVTIKHRLRVQMAEVGCRSIRELSEETGISQNTLHLLDTGAKTNITLGNVFRLLYFFDCPFEDLFQAEMTTNEPDHWGDLTDDVQQDIDEARKEYLKARNNKRSA